MIICISQKSKQKIVIKFTILVFMIKKHKSNIISYFIYLHRSVAAEGRPDVTQCSAAGYYNLRDLPSRPKRPSRSHSQGSPNEPETFKSTALGCRDRSRSPIKTVKVDIHPQASQSSEQDSKTKQPLPKQCKSNKRRDSPAPLKNSQAKRKKKKKTNYFA